MADRQMSVSVKTASDLLDDASNFGFTATYAGLILEDFLEWRPQTGSNPAAKIHKMALELVETETGRIETLHETYGHEVAVREQLAQALTNVTVRDTDPTRRAIVVEKLMNLASRFLGEPVFAEIIQGLASPRLTQSRNRPFLIRLFQALTRRLRN